MSNIADAAFRSLRAEVQRLSGHSSDRMFLVQHLDRFEAWMTELERQYLERQPRGGAPDKGCRDERGSRRSG